MSRKRFKAEEIVNKLRESNVSVLLKSSTLTGHRSRRNRTEQERVVCALSKT